MRVFCDFSRLRLKVSLLALVISLLSMCTPYTWGQTTRTIGVQNGGSLTYSLLNVTGSCSPNGNDRSVRPLFGGYNYIEYYNIKFTDINGASFNLGTADWDIAVCSGSVQNSPTQLNGPEFVLYFSGGSSPSATVQYGSVSGTINPKYVVLAVTYAPPGIKSNVNYSNSTAQSTSTSISKTFTDQTNVSVTVGATGDFGIFGGSSSVTASTAYTQEKDTSSSIALSTTTNNGRQILGPLNSALGIDHDYDIIWVWLNPLVNLNANYDKTLTWTSYAYDPRDIPEMDIVPLYVTWLQNPQTIPPAVANSLARSWDTSGAGGLTDTDYLTILARDPMLNPSFNPNTDTSGRFDLQAGHDFNYEPPPAGGQPITETYSLSSQTTSQAGQGATDTYQVGLGIDAKFKAGLFWDKISVELKASNTATWVNKNSTLQTNTSGQQASLSVTGPAASDNYTGPTTFEVWKDNVYGTFMFYPAN